MANLSITVIDGNNISVAVAARATQTVTIDRSVSGPTGPIGLVWKGAWSGATSYILNDGVSFGGSSYICILANTNNTPPNGTYWNLLAQNGSVTSVGLSAPAIFTVSGSPVTSTGTLALSYSGTALPVPNGGTGLTSLTAGYVPFGAGTSALNSSSNLFWDNTNTRLGVGTASPAFTLDVNGTVNALLSTGYRATTLDRPNVRPSLLLDFADTRLLDPRITFTRASTATFYDTTTSALAEQNLLTYSQDLSNAAWTKTNSTATANYTTAPDGTNTASAFYESAVSSTQHSAQATGNTSGLPVTFSCYLKKGDGVTAPDWIQITTGGGSAAHANFNLTTGLAGNTDVTSTITSVGSGWYRCTMTITTNNSAVAFILSFTNNTDSTVRYASSAYLGVVTSNVFVWGAQLEQRSAVTAYTPTTTAAITNYIPVLQTAASGAARFDCNPTTRESLGLLIEESRTNLLTYSSDFSNAAWTKTASSITTAANIAPDGTQTAQKLVEDSTNGQHYVKQDFTSVSGTTYTATYYVKAAGRTWCMIAGAGLGFATGPFAFFNLATGVVGTTGNSAVSSSIQSVGDSWYRVSMTATATTANAANFRMAPATADNTYPASYTGDGYSGVFIWGAQLEAGSFATSYIPTVASQVTRAVDAASITGTNFSSWYNTTQGSLFSNWANEATSATFGCPVAIDDGTASNRMQINAGVLSAYFNPGAGSNVGSGASVVSGIFQNASLTYGKNLNSYCANGGTVYSATPTLLPVVNQLEIGRVTSAYLGTLHVKRIAYYPVALTSTQLQAITS